MSKKIITGCHPRCGKTLKSTIEKILNDMPYHYYDDPRYKNFRDELRKERQRALNCSDKAPHQEEIEYLESLGLSYPVIRRILEQKYYSNIQEISK